MLALGGPRKRCPHIREQAAESGSGRKDTPGRGREEGARFFEAPRARDRGGALLKERAPVAAAPGRLDRCRSPGCSKTDGLTARHHGPGLTAVLLTASQRESRGQAATGRRLHSASCLDRPEPMARHLRQHGPGATRGHGGLDGTLPTGRLPEQKRHGPGQVRHHQHGGDHPVAPRARHNQPATKKGVQRLGRRTTGRPSSGNKIQAIPLPPPSLGRGAELAAGRVRFGPPPPTWGVAMAPREGTSHTLEWEGACKPRTLFLLQPLP